MFSPLRREGRPSSLMLLMDLLNGPPAFSLLAASTSCPGSDRSLTIATGWGRGMQIHLSALLRHFSGLYMSETNNASEVRSAFCSLPPHSDHIERCCRQLEMQAWRRSQMCRNSGSWERKTMRPGQPSQQSSLWGGMEDQSHHKSESFSLGETSGQLLSQGQHPLPGIPEGWSHSDRELPVTFPAQTFPS